MSKEWGIQYGVLGDKIAFQLASQGINLPLKMCDHWERLRDSANRLHLSDTMTDREYEKVLARLHKRIKKQVDAKYGGRA